MGARPSQKPAAAKSESKRDKARRRAAGCKNIAAKALHLSADEMADVKVTMYEKCSKKREIMTWSETSKFLMDPLIESFLLKANVTKDDVFIDVGSGVGNVIESVATRVGCRCIGIEINKHNYEVSVEAAEHFRTYRRANNLPDPEVTYVNGDVLKNWDVVKEGTVVWCANKLFPMSVDCFMSDAIKDLKPGTRFMTMKDLLVHKDVDNGLQWEDAFQWFNFDTVAWGEGGVEWTRETGSVHLYTRTDCVREE